VERRLAFRHPLIRQALYDGIPGALRSALHRHAAQALATAGVSAERVAAQLLLAPAGTDAWTVDWLTAAVPVLSDRAPHLAVELLQRTLAQLEPSEPRWQEPALALARLQFRLGRNAETQVRQVLAHPADHDRAAEMRWILADQLILAGRIDDALDSVRQGLAEPDLPDVWRARLRAMEARVRSNAAGDLGEAEDVAHHALAFAESTGDRLAVGYSLLSLSTIALIRRDQTARLSYLDRALGVVGTDLDIVDLRLLLLGNRAFALMLLDRFAAAEATLREARELAERRTGYVGMARFHLPAAVLAYWQGRWEDALAELDAASDLPDNRRHALMVAGMRAVIAWHRDEVATAISHVEAVRDQPISTPFELANSGFILVARARIAERHGQLTEALEVLSVLLEPRYAVTERHFQLPNLVRLCVLAGDLDTANRAVQVCEADALRWPAAARTAALAYCRGVLADDTELLGETADYYRNVGRIIELACVQEDIAEVFARRGDAAQARSAAADAMTIYANAGAVWDMRRTDARLRQYGIRQGARGPRRRPTRGWEALSPTELTIAGLVAKGHSNPDIAIELLLSRRTVQSHISKILTKLNAHSRIEIAWQATRHTTAPPPGRQARRSGAPDRPVG
jgi:DNA-binding CsgD family transcriptional regulator